MDYVLSDPHGEYELFRALLDKIGFGDGDRLIVVGDVLDKGGESLRLLHYVLSHPNILLVLGNHEYDFLKYCHGVMARQEDGFDQDAALKEIRAYFGKEGASLEWSDVERLEACPLYYETDDYLCVHAGVRLRADGTMIHPKDTEEEHLVYDRGFKRPDLHVRGEKCVLFGHTPTRYLTGRDEMIFYPRDGVVAPRSIRDYARIHLDCGSYLGKTLGCLCVDNCRAYYASLY